MSELEQLIAKLGWLSDGARLGVISMGALHFEHGTMGVSRIALDNDDLVVALQAVRARALSQLEAIKP